MYCSQCGAKNDEAARFCSSCGAAMQPGMAPARQTTGATLAIVAALVVAVIVGGVILYQRSGPADRLPTEDVGAAIPAPDQPSGEVGDAEPPTGLAPTPGESVTPPEEATTETEEEPSPVPAADKVAEATVALENYLAADLGHDGAEMAKYLGGQAAARFRPEVVGQEDLTVHSKQISSHTVKDANTIVFVVTVKWSPSDSDEVMTDQERYVVRRTDRGWKITSTPEYP
ncbi:MAG: zinc ribbon domain-containing protein [Armatimonadetes bacterium]|nr:zinc ribbon domain-containing protein [Armatimonadota bacterium]